MDHRKEGESNLDWFERYVMNEIPIRLIRLSDMTFVERNNVKKHFRGSVPEDNPVQRGYWPSNFVKYVILSHRWLDDGEPTYEEMKSGTPAGVGYEKLKKFCEKAQEYNVEFAWSDTCCIDKTSGTELDESIRAMFRWYRNSEICIVHLAQTEIIEDMVDDEWMRRGWTLQELLAPVKMKLFNKHWMPMTGAADDKNLEATEVMTTLERATHIPLMDLSRFAPSPSKVDIRMRWAARRKTTRVEDVAYSLMGIFDVSLQIAYGEGGERAFCRLIEAILQGGNCSVFNWHGECADHHSSLAIPRSPQNFAGEAFTPVDWSAEPLEMTTTSLGLRVPLVVFPLLVTSFTSRGVSWAPMNDVSAECLLCPSIKIDFQCVSGDPNTAHYALGIVDYLLESGFQSQIRGRSTCFILRRERQYNWCSINICQPKPSDFIGLKTVSPPEHGYCSWKKVDGQSLITINFPNIPSESIFYVSRG